MIPGYNKKLETYLNSDPELQRRLKGFKTFSGTPDGHYKRARLEGEKSIARAVKCYPFGGKSLLDGHEIISIINEDDAESSFAISLNNNIFSVKKSEGLNPLLTLALPKEVFKNAMLGRYRWLWVIGMDEVKVKYSDDLPHSDWVTILEILVAMQEMSEFDPGLREEIERL